MAPQWPLISSGTEIPPVYFASLFEKSSSASAQISRRGWQSDDGTFHEGKTQFGCSPGKFRTIFRVLEARHKTDSGRVWTMTRYLPQEAE